MHRQTVTMTAHFQDAGEPQKCSHAEGKVDEIVKAELLS